MTRWNTNQTEINGKRSQGNLKFNQNKRNTVAVFKETRKEEKAEGFKREIGERWFCFN